MTLLAVDVGGTKVAVALVTSQGDIRAKSLQATDRAGPEAVADQVVRLARTMKGRDQMQAVGACVPAALEGPDTDRVIWAPNLPGWRDVPFREMLAQRLEAPVFLEFDGHSAALGEWWVGAGKGYQNVAVVIIGTGIGGGFIVDGRLWRGRDRLAGAIGWFPLAGPEGIDHWENLASGPAIARRTTQLLASGRESVLKAGTFTAKDVFAAARRDDPLARQVIREAAETIGQGVASVISLTNPEIVVLGGSIGQQEDMLLETVRDTAARWSQPISVRDVPVVSSTLGEEAGLLGAAYAAYQRLSS